MMNIIPLMTRHRVIFLYLVFGGLTTLVNVVSYALCYEYCSLNNVCSTCVAWLVSVLFAFISNKLYVFQSKDMGLRLILWEWCVFALCRLLTGFLDVYIMYVAVDIFGLMPIMWKILANLIVIISNWLISKHYVFKKTRVTQRKDSILRESFPFEDSNVEKE